MNPPLTGDAFRLYPSGYDPEELWQEVLSELRGQMLAATFNQWVLGGRALPEPCTPTFLVIVTPGEAARQWLTHRLYPVVARTTGYLAGGPVTLCFISRQRGNGRLGTAMRLPEREEEREEEVFPDSSSSSLQRSVNDE